MAVRMHVVAVRGADAGELAATLGDPGPGPSGEGDGVAWMRLSSRGAAAGAIDNAIDPLGKPALRVTTVDGSYWVLRLSRPSGETFTAEHHFSLLDLDNLVLEAESLGELAESSGLSEWIGDAEGKIDQEAVDALIARQAEAIAGALADFGFGHDVGEVRGILTGEAVTPTELGWDAGNLPRLLEALGLGGAVEGWRDDLDAEEAELAEGRARLAAIAARPLAGMRERLDGVSVEPLEGGAVTLPVSDIFLLLDLADQCAGGFAAGCELDADGNEAVLEAAKAVEGVFASRVDGALQILADHWADLWPQTRGVAAALRSARNGTALEVMTTLLYGEGRAADQRYAGRIEGGEFIIERAHPTLTADTLSEALELIREGRAEGALTLRDEEEGKAVQAEVADAIWFFHGPPGITIEGDRLTVDRADAVEGVVQYLFIRRYGSIWDVEARAEFHRREARRAKG